MFNSLLRRSLLCERSRLMGSASVISREEQFEDYGEGEDVDFTPSSPCPEEETRTNGFSDLGSSLPSRLVVQLERTPWITCSGIIIWFVRDWAADDFPPWQTKVLISLGSLAANVRSVAKPWRAFSKPWWKCNEQSTEEKDAADWSDVWQTEGLIKRLGQGE